MTQPHRDIEIRIISQPRYLCAVRAAIGTALERLGWSEEIAGQIMLAVDEALTNIIRHGYGGREDQPIWIYFSPAIAPDGRAGIEITIEDEGRQIDPQEIKSRALEDIRPGGLGVHIITKIMDEVRYAPRAHVGMQLTMHKWAPLPASHPSKHGTCK